MASNTPISNTNEPTNRNFADSVIDENYFFTGTVERVLTWNRIFKRFCYFEVIATVRALHDGPQSQQKIILLRDKKGPILQVIYFSLHNIDESEITVGQILRCVGYMTGVNALTAVSIRKATSDEMATLKRHCYIGDFTISGVISERENNQ